MKKAAFGAAFFIFGDEPMGSSIVFTRRRAARSPISIAALEYPIPPAR